MSRRFRPFECLRSLRRQRRIDLLHGKAVVSTLISTTSIVRPLALPPPSHLKPTTERRPLPLRLQGRIPGGSLRGSLPRTRLRPRQLLRHLSRRRREGRGRRQVLRPRDRRPGRALRQGLRPARGLRFRRPAQSRRARSEAAREGHGGRRRGRAQARRRPRGDRVPERRPRPLGLRDRQRRLRRGQRAAGLGGEEGAGREHRQRHERRGVSRGGSWSRRRRKAAEGAREGGGDDSERNDLARGLCRLQRRRCGSSWEGFGEQLRRGGRRRRWSCCCCA